MPPAAWMPAVASIMRETFDFFIGPTLSQKFYLDLRRSKGGRENHAGVFERQPTFRRSQKQGPMARVWWLGNFCALQLWRTREELEEWPANLAKEVGLLWWILVSPESIVGQPSKIFAAARGETGCPQEC